MFCIKCGSQVNDNDKYCLHCGAPQVKEEIQPSSVNVQSVQPQPEENHLADVLCTISLLLYFAVPGVLSTLASAFSEVTIVSMAFGILDLLSVLAAYILMIIARVKCPTSNYAKVVMWIYIVLLFVGILLAIIFIAACGACINA